MKKPLWEPSAERKNQANMTRFIQFVNRKFGKDFKDYPELYEWSIQRDPGFLGRLLGVCRGQGLPGI